MNSCAKFYLGEFYAACWLIISVWGVLFIGCLGLMFNKGSPYLGHFSNKYTDKQRAQTCLWTFVVYLVLIVLCSINLFYRLKHPLDKGQEETEKTETFASIVKARRARN